MATNYRLIFFLTGIILFSSLEFFFSYRKRELQRKDRWPFNFLLIGIGSILSKIMIPYGLAYISILCNEKQWGLFHQVNLDGVTELILSLFILDFAIYWQHLLFHKNKWLWKLHRVHHSDIDLDTTSALRFHPLEIFISMIYKVVLVFTLGLSVESILVFEIVLNFMAMFNHSNLMLPAVLERWLRFFIVTPQMHIIHHSVEQYESDTNYGFNFPFWDRIFRTYTDEFSSQGIIGQKKFRSKRDHSLTEMLKQPFI